MRPSRLHTTTLCVSSDISAASRPRSWSMRWLASATFSAMSSRSCVRWRTSWLMLCASPCSGALPTGTISCGRSPSTRTCACSSSRGAAATCRWYSSWAPQAPSAHKPRPTSISTMPLWSSAAPSTWRCGSSSVAQKAAPPPSANSASSSPGASSAASRRLSTCFKVPRPASRRPWRPAPWWRRAWSCRRRHPRPGPCRRRCRGPWR